MGGRIEISDSPRQVKVVAGGVTVAESSAPVVLTERGLPPRIYLRRSDVRMDLLEPTDTSSTCPFKGKAEYWSLRVGDELLPDVVWSYPDPIPAAEKIAGLLSFYPEKVELYVDDERW